MELVWPAAQYLSGYVHALQQNWSPDNLRPEVAAEQLTRIAQDPDRFLAEQIDREAKGPPVVLPDGSTVPRLPVTCSGCGTQNSADRLGFAGSRALRNSLHIVWDTLDTRSSRGNDSSIRNSRSAATVAAGQS